MNMTFLNAFRGEWLKKKRSFVSWLVIAGALFTPAIVIVARLVRQGALPQLYADAAFWNTLWKNAWESMALFFLPMCAILIVSLVTQIETRNNAWKQVHALPLGRATIYFSKYLVVLLMMLTLFVLFNIGIYLSAIVPWLLVGGMPYPQGEMPVSLFLRENALYFVDCLPIVAAQYAMSMRLRNFMVPIVVGFLTWVGALGALPWKYAYAIPYTYTLLNYLKNDSTGKAAIPDLNFHWLAVVWFVAFTAIGYALFAWRDEKG